MRRIVIFLFACSVISMWIMASQVWAQAEIIGSNTLVSITGLNAYPQLTFILVAWSIIFAIGRYINSIFGKFLISSVSVLLFATAAPVWFESASGSMSILSPEITKVTGISDWISQGDVITNPIYNHLSADLFLIGMIVGLVSSLFYLWMGLRSADSRNFTTRIDNLPRW